MRLMQGNTHTHTLLTTAAIMHLCLLLVWLCAILVRLRGGDTAALSLKHLLQLFIKVIHDTQPVALITHRDVFFGVSIWCNTINVVKNDLS